MTPIKLNMEKAGGVLIGLLGFIVAYRWLFGSDLIATLIPGSAQMGLLTPIMFMASGVCCFLVNRVQDKGSVFRIVLTVCIGVLLVLPLLVLSEHMFNINLGIDWPGRDSVPSPSIPHPGRPAPNTCVSFFCAGIAIYLMRNRVQNKLSTWALNGAILCVLAIGLTALAGHFLRLESLYRVAAFNRMLARTALGMSVLGFALWFAREKAAPHDRDAFDETENRITYRAVTILTIVALGAGVTALAVMRDTFEKSISDNILLTATTNATSLANTLDVSLWFPRTIATRPTVRQAMVKLASVADDKETRDFLQRVGESFLTTGIAGVQFFDAQGRLLTSAGKMVRTDTTSANLLRTAGQTASLLWQEGYLLATENNVLDGDRMVGTIRTEQRLPIFDQLLTDIRKSNASSDILICGLDKGDALCAPTRFYPASFRIPMYKPDRTLNLPINRALAGQIGVQVTNDLRGVPVMAAFTPIRDFGLGMVVKTNVETIYVPLKERINLLLGILALLVVLGTSTLLVQVRPLLVTLTREQRRIKVILENSHDAFVALGVEGFITDWNAEAERTFGWSAHEAIGNRLENMIIPQAQRRAHNLGFQRFMESGTGPLISKRTEICALCRDGREIPVEISIAAFHNGTGYIATAFLRDISQRKAAEEKLASSEKRLQSITDNLPVLISYIDKEHRFQFGNATFDKWLGIAPADIINRPVEEVIGATLYQQRRSQINQALLGKRIDFETVSEAEGGTRHLQVTYIPDRLHDGSIAGIYTMSTDISKLKDVEQKLSLLARFDTLTGLANRHQLNEKLDETVNRSRRSGASMAVMFLDIDHFKKINDSHGHGAGDAVLQEFAKRLCHCVRITDTVARLAGDEFVILVEGLHSADEPEGIARKILAAVEQAWHWKGETIHVTTSIGIAFSRVDHVNASELMELADQALYDAKDHGRNTFRIRLPQS